MKSVMVRLDEELLSKLKEEAKEKGLSLSAYIRMLLKERGK
jgi:predicted DNA binding CopG/RHH family protein